MPLFNLNPTILPQTAGDIEEARIKRLMDLAQLEKLRQDPIIEQRRLALAKAGLDEQTLARVQQNALGTAQLEASQRGQDMTAATATRGQNIDIRGQDVQARGQDIEAFARERADATARRGQDFGKEENALSNKTQLEHEILVRSFTQPAEKLRVGADTARKFGLGELADVLDAGHAHETEAKAKQSAVELAALKNDPKGYQAKLTELQADPDVLEHIKKTTPGLLAPVVGTPAAPTASSEFPGYVPSNSSPILDAVVNAPARAVNTTTAAFNFGPLPTINAVASAFGAPPLRRIKKQPYYATYKDAFR